MLVTGPSSPTIWEPSFAVAGGPAPCLVDVQRPPLLLLTSSACLEEEEKMCYSLSSGVRTKMKSSPALLMLIEEEEKMCYTATTHR
jgi:hypothetical protein